MSCLFCINREICQTFKDVWKKLLDNVTNTEKTVLALRVTAENCNYYDSCLEEGDDKRDE